MAETRQPEFVESWIASIPRSMIANIGCLREYSNVEVCDVNEQPIWIRGSRLEEPLHLELRSLLGCEIFQQLEDGQLVPNSSNIPKGYAPQGKWVPLRSWLTIALPLKRYAASLEPTVAISLVRSPYPKTPSLLRTSVQTWTNYAAVAPKIRLNRLQFACNHEQVVIIGEPLPPIKGDYFFLRQGIATPMGFEWEPALDARVLRNVFKLEDDGIVVLLPENRCHVISGSQFVGASRSAARLTAEALNG